MSPPNTFPSIQHRSRSASSNRSRTPTVHFETPDGRSSSELEMTKEEKVKANCNIRDIRERIKSMKRWRKELERSVYWQREEYWRIKKVMGKERDSDDWGRIPGEDGWGVGGKTWEKGRYVVSCSPCKLLRCNQIKTDERIADACLLRSNGRLCLLRRGPFGMNMVLARSSSEVTRYWQTVLSQRESLQKSISGSQIQARRRYGC